MREGLKVRKSGEIILEMEGNFVSLSVCFEVAAGSVSMCVLMSVCFCEIVVSNLCVTTCLSACECDAIFLCLCKCVEAWMGVILNV